MAVTNFVYTHSSYRDVLDIWLAQAELFGARDIVIASNEKVDGYNTVLYDESLSYSERLIQTLEQLDCQTVLYQHEDHILYGQPNWENIEQVTDFFPFDFFKLCYTGNLQLNKVWTFTYEVDNQSPDFFAVQPTLWNRKAFISFLKKAGPNSIWDLEINGRNYSQGLKGYLFIGDNMQKRGGHYDSEIYPCILTAICKGKWNMEEYKEELNHIFKINNVVTTRIFT